MLRITKNNRSNLDHLARNNYLCFWYVLGGMSDDAEPVWLELEHMSAARDPLDFSGNIESFVDFMWKWGRILRS